MSTQTRQPSGIPAGGQFATTTHAEPVVRLDAPRTADDELEELTDQARVIGSRQEKAVTLAMEAGATTALDVAERRRTALALATNPAAGRPDFTDYVNPRTITEVRKALKDAKSGKVRGVLLRNEAVAKLDGRLDVAGPADGTPLFVDTSSGFSPLRVTSGTVVVNARST